jgi:hypothetical protein
MKQTTNGGTMDAIYTAPLAARRPAATGFRTAVASLASLLVEVVKGGVEGHEFERAFTSAAGAQFAALPAGSKQRTLNRGFRP